MAAPSRNQKTEDKPEPVEPAVTRQRFIPSVHTTGTTTPSGATFSLSPGVPVTVSSTDADALVAQGLGSIQEG